jgi:ABC-type cobalt transport system substrate-binding protein
MRLLLLLLLAANAQAETKYNPYTRSYDTAQSGVQTVQPRYNPYTTKYEMTTKDSTIVYNPYSHTYNYVSTTAKKP